jgi:Ca-activated chloride channel family protein
MNWGDPSYLHALWLLLPLALALRLLHRRGRRLLARLADTTACRHLIAGWRPDRAATRLTLWFLAMACLVTALARPQWGFRWEEVRRRGLDLLILLDTSRSMLAPDLKPTRLDQAKWGVRDLTRTLHGDRIGLVTFAGTSYLQCPLTIDYAAFLMTLDDVYVGALPRGGTAIAEALRTALDTFEKQSQGERVVVLITDGEDHEGDPLALLDELKARNVRIYAIGVGTREGELLPAADGAAGFLKDRSGQVVKSTLQEDLLTRLAVQTGGAYIRAAPGDLGLERLMEEQLSALTRQETDSRVMKQWEERAGWLIAAGLLLLAAEASLRERKAEPREESA